MAHRVRVAVLGGTFDHLHAGHRALLTAGFAYADRVGIGITTDEVLRQWATKKGTVEPFSIRKSRLERWLRATFPRRSWWLIPLRDRWGAVLEPTTEALIVSEETLRVAEEANRRRRRRGLRPLALGIVHPVLAEDLLPISSTRIRLGEIDSEGRRLRPLVVGVGTTNRVKVEGVRRGLARALPRLRLKVVPVPVGGPNPQPWGEREGLVGARHRAAVAVAGRDYGVGVEAFIRPSVAGPGLMDEHAIALQDRTGAVLESLSAAFRLPEGIAGRVHRGGTLEDAVVDAGAPSRVGHRPGGAVGHLTEGLLTREEVIAEALASALVPRLASRRGRLPASTWRPAPRTSGQR